MTKKSIEGEYLFAKIVVSGFAYTIPSSQRAQMVFQGNLNQ